MCEFCFKSYVEKNQIVAYKTLSGCPCTEVWMVTGHEPCLGSCCSPDGDFPWCQSTCEANGWGYCDIPLNFSVMDLSYPEEFWFEGEKPAEKISPSAQTRNGNNHISISIGISVLLISLGLVLLRLSVRKSRFSYTKSRKRSFREELES